MTLSIDDTDVQLDCPACGRQFKQKLGRLKSNPTIKCPGCQQPIKIEASGLRKAVDKANESLGKLGAALKRLDKKR